jgi:hypothetical protein
MEPLDLSGLPVSISRLSRDAFTPKPRAGRRIPVVGTCRRRSRDRARQLLDMLDSVWTSFKDLQKIMRGCPGDHSRISDRSFDNLRRAVDDLRQVLRGCPTDPSRISDRSFEDLRQVLQGSPTDHPLSSRHPSRISGTSFKDLRDILRGPPRHPSRISERSFEDLQRSSKDPPAVPGGPARDPSKDQREIVATTFGRNRRAPRRILSRGGDLHVTNLAIWLWPRTVRGGSRDA